MAIDDSEATFLVVLNHEAQYSIWPSFRPVPQGWAAVLAPCYRAVCSRVARSWGRSGIRLPW